MGIQQAHNGRMAVGYLFSNLGWHPYPEHGSFYKMERGVLKYMPMRNDGSMVVDEISDVDYCALSADEAARCREIEDELQKLC